MKRNQTLTVAVGKLRIGGGNPIVIQSMTDTPTADLDRTFKQTAELADAGAELVRVTVNDGAAARAVPELRKKLDDAGYGDLPLAGDFHFIGHRLLNDNPDCVSALSKLRINPGNVGRGANRDANFTRFIEIARDTGKAVRIGVNAGSLDQELLSRMMDENSRRAHPLSSSEVERDALVASAVSGVEQATDIGLAADRIIVSCKVSDVNQMVSCYRLLAERIKQPLHLGLTEAGTGQKGTVATTAALSVLLRDGIGDTIRASLTPGVGMPRAKEVELCQTILQVLGIRSFKPQIVACPGCGRTGSDKFRKMADKIQSHIDATYKNWRNDYPGSENLKVAVMGCVVNGPGESRNADIGISLPGGGEEPRAPIYVDGKKTAVLSGASMTEQFIKILDGYVEKKWGGDG